MASSIAILAFVPLQVDAADFVLKLGWDSQVLAHHFVYSKPVFSSLGLFLRHLLRCYSLACMAMAIAR
jgi:hypothetical protein